MTIETADSDLNILMNLVAEINTKPADSLTSVDLDALIAYYRRQRQRRATGEKLSRTTAKSQSTPNVDVLSLLSLNSKPASSGPKLRR